MYILNEAISWAGFEVCAVWSIFTISIFTIYRAASKYDDLLTSGDPDINPICIKYILPNTGVYKQENVWSFVNLFHIVSELLHFTFTLLLNWHANFDLPTNF